jgi:hypothetical protein
MLGPLLMKSHLIAWSSLALLLPLGTVACGADVQANVAVQTPAPPVVGGEAPVSGDVAVGDNADAYEDNDPSALQDFHPALDNNGTWQDDPTYGTVWVPSQQVVGADFTPYQTAGHWVYGDDSQYVWVSDYDWGWAPFHYGRWVPLDAGGWAWIPGREYRGAWVNWGADDAYANVGWYPMGPEFVWRGGVAVGYSYNVAPRWAYVGRGDVFAPNLGARLVVGSAAVGFAGSVHPMPMGAGARFSSGPAPGKLGFSGAQIPHLSGAAAASIGKATTFSHPSTAVAAGGHPATRTGTPSALGHLNGGGTVAGGTSATMPGVHGNLPTTTPAGGGTVHGGAAGSTTFPTSHGNVPTTGGAATTHEGGGTVSGGVHGNLPTTTPSGGGGSVGTAGSPAPHGNAAGGVTPGVQPQPKKKPVPQQGTAPAPKGGGSKGGGKHK